MIRFATDLKENRPSTFDLTMNDLIRYGIPNVPEHSYHEFLLSDYAKNNPVLLGHRTEKVMFLEYVNNKNLYILLNKDGCYVVTLNENPVDPTEYSDTDWSVFVERSDGSVTFLWHSENAEETFLNGEHNQSAKVLFGDGAKMFGIRKMPDEFYVFKHL